MEQQQLRQALIALSAIDAHFLTWQYIQFLREFADMNTVTNDNVNFLVSVVNIPNLDNAFFVQYMAFGNGKDFFNPFATVDCVGHELSHGFCQRVCGLVYKGHAGALNESMADIVAFFFERWLYLKFNSDADQTNDIAGQWDFFIGEDNGRQFRYMRNLRNPKDCPIPQPDTFKGEFWKDPNNEQDDFGGVHANSGVANRLACLIMEAIGFNLAGKMLVAAWRKLKPLSNYLHYRDALKQVASEMNCLAQVQTCLNNVGLTDGAINDWNPK
jgi:bacillolysin/thermolysin